MYTDRLHNGTFLSEFLSELRRALIDEIKSLDGKKSIDIEYEKERLLLKYTQGPLKVAEPIPAEPRREKKMIYNNWGQQIEADVYLMKIQLPFEGNGDLFYCKPSICNLVYPKIDSISNQSKKILFTIELSELSEDTYRKAVGSVVSDLKINIPNVNNDISSWDSGLKNLIDSEFSKFEGFLSKKNSFYESIGLKVTSKADQFITPSPITRKPVPIPKLEETGSIKKIHPKLKEEVYKDIITTLNNVGRAIERKPSLYKGKGEEDLRDMFLLFLETRYEGTSATGETFNKNGKTDILLRYANDGSNLFIGECKIWKGTKIFHDTIDQILGYLTWQDSKSSILLFIDNDNLDNVKNTVKAEIQNHSSFKTVIQEGDESFSYTMTLKDDKTVNFSLEVIFFHLPERK
ncbi:MAG: hypothetical protein ACOYOT_03080 [Bacteroidales bacterium]